MPSLQTMSLGSYNMRYVRNFTIDGFPSLQTLYVGEYSFRSSTSTQKSGSEVVIRNCQNLISVSLQDYAFADFQKLIMTNLTSLQSITTNYHSFRLLSSFEFSGRNCMRRYLIIRIAFTENNEFRKS